MIFEPGPEGTAHSVMTTKQFLVWLIIIMIAYIGYVIYEKKDCCECGVSEELNFIELGEALIIPSSHNCCPCPNNDHFEEVKNYYGRISGSGDWYVKCEKFKIETNQSFDCFE